MTTLIFPRCAGIALVCTLMLVAGCASTSPKSDFYTLSTDSAASTLPEAAQHCANTAVGIGPVSWPRYLDQPRIVTRPGPNRLEFNEFHRWGGSLQDDFERVLIRNLSQLLDSERVDNAELSARIKPDYRVELDVRQFDGRLGGVVTLDVRWDIIQHGSDKARVVKNSLLQETASDPTYDALVEASSRAVAGLAREIAVALAALCPVE
jgi:uncharacterized lipoprotein YmbA